MNKKLSETNKQDNDFILNLITSFVLTKLWYIGWAFKWEIVNINTCAIATILLLLAYFLYKSLRNSLSIIYLGFIEYFTFLPYVSVFSSTFPYSKASAHDAIVYLSIFVLILTIIILPTIINSAYKSQASLINIIKTAFKKHTPSQEEYHMYLPLILSSLILSCIYYPLFERIQNYTLNITSKYNTTPLIVMSNILQLSVIVYYTYCLLNLCSLFALGCIKQKGMTFQPMEKLPLTEPKDNANNSSLPASVNKKQVSQDIPQNTSKSEVKSSRSMQILHKLIIIILAGLLLIMLLFIIAESHVGCGNIGETIERRF